MHDPAPSPAPLTAPRTARRRAPGPRLFVAGEPSLPPTSTYIEPVETPIAINGWPARLHSWTAEQWEALGAFRPAGALSLAGGVRVLFIID